MTKKAHFLPFLLWLLFVGCSSQADVVPTVSPIRTTAVVSGQGAAANDTPTATTGQATPVLQRTPATATPLPLATPTTPPIPQAGGEITIGLLGSLSDLNPLTDLDLALQPLVPLLYGTLNRFDPQTAARGDALAALPVITPDGRSITLRLAAGGPTPADLQASLEGAVWPALATIESVAITGPLSVTLTLSAPDCLLVERLTQFPLLKAETIQSPQPAGYGPFQTVAWDEAAQRLTLAPNPDWPGQPPLLAGLTVRFFPTEAAARAALIAGDLDLLVGMSQPDEIPSGFQSLAYPAPRLIFISFNNQDPLLAKPAVRQALSLGVDRMGMLETVFAGRGSLAAGFIPANHWAAAPDLTPVPYDPRQAAELLDEAGLVDRDGDGWRDRPDGQTWELPIQVNDGEDELTAIAFLAADGYRRLGIQARAELIPDASVIGNLLTYDYQLTVDSLPRFPELAYRRYWHSDQREAEFGLNLAGYENPQVDAWLDEAEVSPACRPTEQAELYRQIQTQVAVDQPLAFLLIPSDFLIGREDLHGPAPGPFAPVTWNIETWYLSY